MTGTRPIDLSEAAWGSWPRWLVPLIYLGCLIAFIADISVEIFYVPFGVVYIPLICTAVFHKNPRGVWYLACLATAMVVVGFFLPVVAPHVGHGVFVRAISVMAIFITAALVRHARTIREKLAAQTKRAEAAERIKSEVFTTLSQELRNPLQSLVGLSAVMLASCRPDQRPALTLVQNNGARLLAAIENLIDLTTIDDRAITNEAVDVNEVVREAAAASRQAAAERQVALALDFGQADLTARTDRWAMRRILENLIANAVKFSRAGSTIELATEHERGQIALLVRDTGMGMSPDILDRLGRPPEPGEFFVPLTGTGTGLALCRRLALAMGAELAFDSELGAGTTAILRIPA